MSNFILIILLAAFPPLSTDMYLPAIPTLCTIWEITLVQANLSLVAFFISFSAFLLSQNRNLHLLVQIQIRQGNLLNSFYLSYQRIGWMIL